MNGQQCAEPGLKTAFVEKQKGWGISNVHSHAFLLAFSTRWVFRPVASVELLVANMDVRSSECPCNFSYARMLEKSHVFKKFYIGTLYRNRVQICVQIGLNYTSV